MLELKDFSEFYKHAKPAEEETFDLSFEKAVSLVEQENFEQALPLIEKIFRTGSLDIRLIMYRLFADFSQQGPLSFASLFPLIVDLIDKHWEKISPIKMREKYTFSSLLWFFSSITKKLKRSHELQKENRPDALWKLSQETLTPQSIESIEREITRLSTFFSARGEQPAIHEHILYIKKWFAPFKLICSTKDEEKEAPPLIAEEPHEEKSPAEIPPNRNALEVGESPQVQSSKKGLLVSKQMELLIEKLHTFHTLIDGGEMTKAALVSDDIRTILDTFNPAFFFPKLFGPYLSVVAKHIDSLHAEWAQKGSPQWESLKNLYQTDLDEFLKW